MPFGHDPSEYDSANDGDYIVRDDPVIREVYDDQEPSDTNDQQVGPVWEQVGIHCVH